MSFTEHFLYVNHPSKWFTCSILFFTTILWNDVGSVSHSSIPFTEEDTSAWKPK